MTLDAVAKALNAVPPVLVQVIAPALEIVQSPDKATAVAAFEPLPTQRLAELKAGRFPTAKLPVTCVARFTAAVEQAIAEPLVAVQKLPVVMVP